MTPAEVHAAGVAEVGRLRRSTQGHEWRGGYYCECHQELNSPRGYIRHVQEAAPAPAWLDVATEVLRVHEPFDFMDEAWCSCGTSDTVAAAWPCLEVAAVLRALGVGE